MQEKGYGSDTVISMMFSQIVLVLDALYAEIQALKSKCHDEHVWVGQQRGGSPTDADSDEWVEFCDKCGQEKPGE